MYPPEAKRFGNPTHIARTKFRAAIQLALGRGLALLIFLFIVTTTPYVLFSSLALWAILEAIVLWRANRKLWLTRNGLVDKRRRDIRLVRWQDIEAIYWRVHRLTAFGQGISEEQVYIIHLRDGTQLTYSTDNYRGLMELGKELRKLHALHMMTETFAQFDKGQRLRFGDKISVRQDGIQVGNRTILWNNADWQSEGHVLYINGERAASIGDIPNYELLINLLEYAKQ